VLLTEYYLGDKSRIMKWVGHVACTGEKRNAYRVLVGKAEGKTPIERPRCKWEDNIKIYVEEIRLEAVDWINLARVGTRGNFM